MNVQVRIMCEIDSDTSWRTVQENYAESEELSDHEVISFYTVSSRCPFIAEQDEETHDREVILQIRDSLDEYQKIIQCGFLEREHLVDVIIEINSIAKTLDVDNDSLNLVHKLIFNPFEKYGPMYYGINNWKWLLLLVLFVFNLCNTLSNIALSLNYAVQGKLLYAILTIIFISVPSTCYTFAIYSTKRILPNILIAFFNVSPIIRCLHLMAQARLINALSKKTNRINEQEDCFKKLFNEYTVTLENMKQLVGFLSCAPQLTLQVVIFLIFVRSDVDVVRKGLHWFSIGTCIVGLLIALESRLKNVIFERPWLLPMMFARVSSLCILTYRYPTCTIVFITIHWLALTIWWYTYEVRHNLQYTRAEKILYASSEALVTTFVPIKFLHLDVNLVLYIFYFAQTVFANGVWFRSFDELAHSEYLYILVICINVTYFIAGIMGTWLCVNFKSVVRRGWKSEAVEI